MIAKEFDQDMSEVIVDEGPAPKNLHEINVTLAHHAAWTEERFEQVEQRLGGLELGQQAILEGVNGLTTHVDSLATAFVGVCAQMGRMEARITGKVDSLAVRVDRVLAFAIKDEFKLAEVLKDEDESKA